jgi:hypothetical protein
VEAVLLANAASTFFMVGLVWFVDVVHYPLFAAVGDAAFTRYHELHTKRTTWVVLPAMGIELVSSAMLAIDPPADLVTLSIAGAVLAAGTWAITVFAAVPAHRALSAGFTAARLRRLRKADLARALVWTAHGTVVVALLAGS